MINPKACTCANSDRKNKEHTCPYKVAMYGSPAKCTCCEYCTRVCKKDVLLIHKREIEMEARVTISRRSKFQGDGSISISITDAASGINVCDVEMDLADFAECVTGLGASKAEFRMMPNTYKAERYGKKKIVDRVFCEKSYSIKEEMEKIVISHFNENYGDEWELWNDGIGTQQNGNQHQYIICKYVADC